MKKRTNKQTKGSQKRSIKMTTKTPKTRKRTAKEVSIAQLKKELDTYFSEYIRLRIADSGGYVSCFTCGVSNYFRQMQCGHFMSRKNMSTRWDEQNCQVQCPKCNIFNQGEQFVFGLNLDKKYGKGTAESLVLASKKIKKFSKIEYQELIEHYSKLVAELKESLGLF